jgi:hypothetical protein
MNLKPFLLSVRELRFLRHSTYDKPACLVVKRPPAKFYLVYCMTREDDRLLQGQRELGHGSQLGKGQAQQQPAEVESGVFIL